MATVRDPRIEDYLNDKFQSIADLTTVDALLRAVQNQQSLLQNQLGDAEQAAKSTGKEWEEHRSRLDADIVQFRNESIHIERRIQASQQSETSQLVSQNFQTSIDRLQRLDVASAYVGALANFEKLRLDTREALRLAAKDALIPLNKFRAAAEELMARNDESEDAAVQLSYYVEQTYIGLWKEVEQVLSASLKTVLAQIKWPSPDVSLENVLDRFTEDFLNLLKLEDPTRRQTRQKLQLLDTHPHKVLLPFRDLVAPLEIRFRFHFDGDKPTNKPDKPEWFLHHITDLIESYAPFLANDIQPILSRGELASRDALHEFITALLPAVRKKINHLLPVISGDAQLLSHFYHELIKFDTIMRESCLYVPYGVEGQWGGLTAEVLALDGDGGFEKWLTVERDFALDRYQEIIGAPTAWHLDYDSVSPTDAKPTKSSIRLKELLENITETYRPLPSFGIRLRFLMDIQISILDKYLERLHGSVDAFKVLTSSIARTMQGTSKEDIKAVEGVGGLERLCRVIGSAAFLENAMSDWGEDLLFLELWDELQSRTKKAQRNSSEDDPTVTGDLTVDDIANKTSMALTDGEEEGALFDEMGGGFRRLRKQVEEMVTSFTADTVKAELRPYLRIQTWSVDSDVHELGVSQELVPAMTQLNSLLSFLSRAMASVTFYRSCKSIASSLDNYLWDYLLMRSQFSLQGGLQFERDIAELQSCFAQYTTDNSISLKKLAESAKLLSLPEMKGEGQITLKEIVEPVFEDNDRARDTLAALGIRELGVNSARSILQRRVDVWT